MSTADSWSRLPSINERSGRKHFVAKQDVLAAPYRAFRKQVHRSTEQSRKFSLDVQMSEERNGGVRLELCYEIDIARRTEVVAEN